MRTKKVLTDIAKDESMESNKVKGALCIIFDRHMKTIELWIAEKNQKLSSSEAVKAIKKHTGLEEAQILEEVPV